MAYHPDCDMKRPQPGDDLGPLRQALKKGQKEAEVYDAVESCKNLLEELDSLLPISPFQSPRMAAMFKTALEKAQLAKKLLDEPR